MLDTVRSYFGCITMLFGRVLDGHVVLRQRSRRGSRSHRQRHRHPRYHRDHRRGRPRPDYHSDWETVPDYWRPWGWSVNTHGPPCGPTDRPETYRIRTLTAFLTNGVRATREGSVKVSTSLTQPAPAPQSLPPMAVRLRRFNGLVSGLPGRDFSPFCSPNPLFPRYEEKCSGAVIE